MKGYHCYEQFNEPHEWYEIELLIQLLSIRYWKRQGGTIGIFTEPKHIATLEKYDMLKEYDQVDRVTLIEKSKGIDKKRFWAIAKILCQLEIPEEEYCILDTDAFFREMPELHEETSFIGTHTEHHLTEKGKTVYPELDKVFPPEIANKLKGYEHVLPVNTSFLHIRDKELIKLWATDAIETAKWQSKRVELYGEMMSVEQHLLPLLAESLGKTYSSLVDNVYLPGYENLAPGSEWTPHPNEEGNLRDIGKIYFHLWGFKRQLGDEGVRNATMHSLMMDINLNFAEDKEELREKFPTLATYIV